MNDPCSQSSVLEPALVQRRLQQRAEEIADTEREEMRGKFDEHGGLTNEQQEVVETLALRIAQNVNAPPKSMVEQAPRTDQETIRTVAHLFDLDDLQQS